MAKVSIRHKAEEITRVVSVDLFRVVDALHRSWQVLFYMIVGVEA